MRIVVDSNVWVSALVFGGRPGDVFRAVVTSGHTVVLSQEIITEVRRVLHQKFSDFLIDFEDLLVVLKPRTEYVALGAERVDASRDPDDNRVLETALVGRADCIVSGDNDLLSLRKFRAAVIITPADFCAAIAAEK